MSRHKTPIAEAPAARYLRAARHCRARDLQQLSVLSALVRGIGELIHSLQKERGASSIYLGSKGMSFAGQLGACVAEGRRLGAQVQVHLERLDEELGAMSCSARFYARVAFALRALASLPDLRDRVDAHSVTPQDAVRLYTAVIAQQLAVGFEAADIAADPETSRALVALVNFAQGKEYAGQERATAGAALSRGTIDDGERRHLDHLVAAQDRAFAVFADFAAPDHVAALTALQASDSTRTLLTLRATAFAPRVNGLQPVSADTWHEATTRRIDAMRQIETDISLDLERLCAVKLADASARARTRPAEGAEVDDLRATPSYAMLVTDGAGGIEFYGADHELPKPIRSIIDVIEAQSRQIDEITSQLESARSALSERKSIERARGVLMRSRRLSEEDAYTLMRRTAMSQNKRIVEIAEAILSMADIFKG